MHWKWPTMWAHKKLMSPFTFICQLYVWNEGNLSIMIAFVKVSVGLALRWGLF
jgi:hypothetical protein